MKDIWTPRQIVQRIGRQAICAQLRVSREAPRKWYAKGIPARHWETLVDAHGDWLSYDLLANANKVARIPVKRRRK